MRTTLSGTASTNLEYMLLSSARLFLPLHDFQRLECRDLKVISLVGALRKRPHCYATATAPIARIFQLPTLLVWTE